MDFTFLLCSERSGSNLITRLMDNHSQYCGPSPTHAMRIVLENAAGYGDLQDPGNWELLIEDIADLFQAKMGVWATRWTRSELLQITTPGDLSGLFRAFFEREARGHHKNRLFVKENHLYRQWDFIRRHFPEARFVWLVRDPRDMALSWKKSPNLRGCAIRSASIWQQDQSACLSLYHQLENRPFILKIHYEDLVADTPATLRKVCTFLDIP
ncbi:MAG TPA: sulfotransferase, partial [Calditrichia bacterium]|nr:sulfotransferase [Calditrichia bacterium]